jgi:hypothetical protein
MRAGFVKLRDDVGDSVTDPWDVLKPTFGNERVDRQRRCRKVLRRAEIGFGTIGVASAQCRALAEFSQQSGDRLGIELCHGGAGGGFSVQ